MLHHPTGVGATALPAALVTASPPSPPLPRSSLSLGGHRQQSQALCRPRRSAFSLHIAVDEHERPQSSAETGCSSVGRRRLWQPAEPAQAGVVAALLRNNMFPAPSSRGLPPPWPQMPQPVQPGVVSFREANHLRENSRRLEKTLGLAKAVQKELETILLFRKSDGHEKESGSLSEYSSEEDIVRQFLKVIDDKGVDVNLQESLSLEAANSLIRTLRDQLAPFSIISSQTTSWEERSVVARLAQKLQKSKRNKRWRKTKRKQIVEKISKKQEMFDKADQEADEWRAKEMAKDIAKRKVEKMKAIAILKAKEEQKRVGSEVELVLVVEKLQELRSIRVQKLKKQGHFFPEEDDKFLERVRAAVEEEERQAAAAAETSAAKDAIATAEESRKAANSRGGNLKHDNGSKGEASTSEDQKSEMESFQNLRPTSPDSRRGDSGRQGHDGVFDAVASLPFEFYHYYHGSNYDLGTLIEVRRTWDAYIRPGGSRIPGHWVQPPPPSDEVWASYLVGPKP